MAYRSFSSVIVLIVLFMVAPRAGAQVQTIPHDGRNRQFEVHFPPAYDLTPDSSFSVILALHGGFGSLRQLPEQSQLSAKADSAKHPFIVVYANGLANLLVRTWNAGRCCGWTRDNNIDDVGFISSLVDTLVSRYRIDPLRVYATGMSNGAMLAFRLGAELSDKIAAIAPVAGSLVNPDPLDFVSPVPVIQFHSALDENIPVLGGVGTGFSSHFNSPADSSLAQWSIANGCDGDAEVVPGTVGFVHTRWTPCAPRSSVELYVTSDGGHSWPGGTKSAVGDDISTALSANDLMWEFFLAHPRAAVDTAIELSEIPESKVSTGVTVYPNPTRERATFEFVLAGPARLELEIFDLLGRRVGVMDAGFLLAGNHRIVWDRRNMSGADINPGPGLLVYRLTEQRTGDGGTAIRTGKLVIIR